MTLRTRIALISALAVACVVVGAVFAANAAIQRQLLAEIDQSLMERIAPAQRLPGGGWQGGAMAPFPDTGAGLLARRPSGFDALFVQFLDVDGQAYAPPGQPVALPVTDDDRAVAAGDAPGGVRTTGDGEGRLRIITAPAAGGAIQMARSLEEFDRSVAGLTRTMTLIGGIGVALAALLGLALGRGVLRPLDQLTETVEHVAATKELAARIEVGRDDEVGRLARSFNDMLEALQTSRTQQHQLVRDAGHELRTPLTALRTNIEVLARTDTVTAGERTELLDAATSELAELSALVSELVELAGDPDATSGAMEPVALDVLVEQVVDRFRRRLNRPIELTATPTSVTGRPAALERAVGNLIDNADKWSPDGAPIRISVGAGRVAVVDSGPGIDPADRPRVFDRFYRSAEARTRPGSGLGLAIVDKVVTDHGGTVFVDDAATGGALVGFVLPAHPG